MNNLLNITTPAQSEAAQLKSDYGLDSHGLNNLNTIYWNLPAPALYEEIGFRREGRITHRGPVVVNTGKHTSRAASDKIIVREPTSEGHVWWGEYNRPFPADKFNELFTRVQGFVQGRDLSRLDTEHAPGAVLHEHAEELRLAPGGEPLYGLLFELQGDGGFLSHVKPYAKRIRGSSQA